MSGFVQFKRWLGLVGVDVDKGEIPVTATLEGSVLNPLLRPARSI